MDVSQVSAVVNQLDGLEWFIFSGFAVSLYSDAERSVGDLDIALQGDDLDLFADRVGVEVRHRPARAGGEHMEDYGFETVVNDVTVEATNGFPPERRENGAFDKLFDNRVTNDWNGLTVYLVPLEELLVHKAHMFRDKDFWDLRLLREKEVDTAFLDELIADWNLAKTEVYGRLNQCGFDL